MPVNNQREAVRQRVEDYFAQGKPCSQALILALKEEVGASTEVLLQASSALARGLGGTGTFCGALIAGMMVLGMKGDDSRSTGLARPTHEWLDAYTPSRQQQIFQLCQELALRFSEESKKRFGAIQCREISGVDWRNPTPTELSRYYAPDGRVKECVDAVSRVAGDVLELLEQRAAS